MDFYFLFYFIYLVFLEGRASFSSWYFLPLFYFPFSSHFLIICLLLALIKNRISSTKGNDWINFEIHATLKDQRKKGYRKCHGFINCACWFEVGVPTFVNWMALGKLCQFWILDTWVKRKFYAARPWIYDKMLIKRYYPHLRIRYGQHLRILLMLAHFESRCFK